MKASPEKSDAVNVTCSVSFVGNSLPSLECPRQMTLSSKLSSELENETNTVVYTLNFTATVQTAPSSETISCSLLSSDNSSAYTEPLHVWKLPNPWAESKYL
jgi:hypothetical protein